MKRDNAIPIKDAGKIAGFVHGNFIKMFEDINDSITKGKFGSTEEEIISERRKFINGRTNAINKRFFEMVEEFGGSPKLIPVESLFDKMENVGKNLMKARVTHDIRTVNISKETLTVQHMMNK